MQNVRQKIADWDVWFHLSAGSMVPEKPIAGGPWGMDQPTGVGNGPPKAVVVDPEILGELHKVDESFWKGASKLLGMLSVQESQGKFIYVFRLRLKGVPSQFWTNGRNVGFLRATAMRAQDQCSIPGEKKKQ